MAAQLYKTATGQMFHAGNIAIITVGLPARGKTYISHKLSRYLDWLGIKAKIFSVGDYRRRIIGPKSFEWFSSKESADERAKIADLCLEDLIKWITEGGQIGIFDGGNTENHRRVAINAALVAAGIQVLYIESICERDDIIQANIRQVKLTSPDYVSLHPEEAMRDFLKRIEGYKSNYSSVTDKTLSFIKMINVGEQFILNNVKGYLQTRIVYY